MNDLVYQVCLSYATFGIVVDRNSLTCKQAAPIGRWMVGKSLQDIIDWVEKKNGTVNYVEL